MYHATARRLDEPFKLYGFSIPQWLGLLFGGGGTIAALHYLHLGVQVGGFLGTLIVGVPGLYWLLGESGRIEPGELLLDAIRKAIRPARFKPGAGTRTGGLLIEPAGTAEPPTATQGLLEVPWD